MFDKRLWIELKSERPMLYRIIGYKLASLLLSILFAFLFSSALEKVILGKSNIWLLFFPLLLLFLGQWLMLRLGAQETHRLSFAVKDRLRHRLFEHTMAFRLRYNEVARPSEIISLSVEGVEQMEHVVARFLPQLFYSLLAPIVLFIVLAPVHLILALALLLLVPLIPLSIMMIQKLARKVVDKYWGSYVDLSDQFLDFVKGLTTLKIYDADAAKQEQMNRHAEDFRVRTMRVLAVQLHNITVMDLVSFGGSALGILLSIHYLRQGNLSLGHALLFIFLSAEFFLPLRLLGSFFHVATNGMAASKQLFHLLDTTSPQEGQTAFTDLTPRVELEHIRQNYDGRIVLDDIQLSFPFGRTIALVGRSGCGKSTIAKLLLQSVVPTEGRILYQGKEHPRLDDLYRRITFVDHAPYFFQGSLRENLRIAQPDATDAQLCHALRQVQFWDYFEDKGGLDFAIDIGGDNFSGGQKQRLALARAFLKNSPILILDEATSNIDAESEHAIFQALEQKKGTFTVILISHRLVQAQHADTIHYLEDGIIKETGSFEELMSQQGKFYQLYEHQRQSEEWSKHHE